MYDSDEEEPSPEVEAVRPLRLSGSLEGASLVSPFLSCDTPYPAVVTVPRRPRPQPVYGVLSNIVGMISHARSRLRRARLERIGEPKEERE